MASIIMVNRFSGAERPANWLARWGKQYVVRVECTGLYARHYGPFETRAEAKAFYDKVLDEFLEFFDCELANEVGALPMIEIPEGQSRKKRPRKAA